jgi:hypothetical protein
MPSDQWFIHPSRFTAQVAGRVAPTPFRVTARTRTRRADQEFACIARVPMPKRAGGRRDLKGRLDFDGDTWSEVAGSALMFARRRNPKAPRIGIKYPGRKHYSWWDDATSIDDRLTGDQAAEHVKAWLEHLFPAAAGRITVDTR